MIKTRKETLDNVPRIAIIGCGAFTESAYLPAIAKHPSVLERLVLVDSNKERAKGVASAYDVHDYLCDYNDILNEVDAAIVAVPNYIHYGISMDFLLKGVHVLCEKPLAVSAFDAKEMVAQAEKSGVTLCVNNTRRLHPVYLKVKELISNGTIGLPMSIKYFQGWKITGSMASGFRFNWKQPSTGVLMDVGAHVLDIICMWLGGKPKLISCLNDSFGGIDAVTAVTFEHKQCYGEVKLSWLSKLQNYYTVVGELGTIEGKIDEYASFTINYKSGKTEKIKIKCKEKVYNDFVIKIVTNFIDVVCKGAKPLIPASDVIPSIEWIEECYTVATRFNMPWNETLEVPYGK